MSDSPYRDAAGNHIEIQRVETILERVVHREIGNHKQGYNEGFEAGIEKGTAARHTRTLRMFWLGTLVVIFAILWIYYTKAPAPTHQELCVQVCGDAGVGKVTETECLCAQVAPTATE